MARIADYLPSVGFFRPMVGAGDCAWIRKLWHWMRSWRWGPACILWIETSPSITFATSGVPAFPTSGHRGIRPSATPARPPLKKGDGAFASIGSLDSRVNIKSGALSTRFPKSQRHFP